MENVICGITFDLGLNNIKVEPSTGPNHQCLVFSVVPNSAWYGHNVIYTDGLARLLIKADSHHITAIVINICMYTFKAGIYILGTLK